MNTDLTRRMARATMALDAAGLANDVIERVHTHHDRIRVVCRDIVSEHARGILYETHAALFRGNIIEMWEP